MKKSADLTQNEVSSKKIKLEKHKKAIHKSDNGESKSTKVSKRDSIKDKLIKPSSSLEKENFSKKNGKVNKKFVPNNKKVSVQGMPEDKVEDWNAFKKQKKELKLKRIQAKNKDTFEVIKKAKQMSEELRKKTIKDDQRNIIINQLHGMLKGSYSKFVLAHDTARIVQWLLKYASNIVINQISKELIPATVDMFLSKYGIHCVKRLLKYGQNDIRASVINAMQGSVMKLSTHSISAPVTEYAISNWATPKQRKHLLQELFGDLFKNSKDDNVKHLRDIYKDDESLKSATLSATKHNIQKILDKNLLDSCLAQTAMQQFLEECSQDDRSELIGLLAPHIVVISNSKNGARAAMQCIWQGSNKDRKVIMKALKEHLIDISKHEHGHITVIALLDCADDTVLLHKVIVSQLLENAKDLAISKWGRKVLLWLVAPGDTTIFHPAFVNELQSGRQSSTSKKSIEIRQKEILQNSAPTLLKLVLDETEFWLTSPALAMEMVAIIKAGEGDDLKQSLESITNVISNPDWKVKLSDKNDTEILGIEHAGLHMALKKLGQNDKSASENNKTTFGDVLAEKLSKELLKIWLKINRGCYLLATIFDNNSEEVRDKIKQKVKKHIKLLEQESSQGSKILLEKL